MAIRVFETRKSPSTHVREVVSTHDEAVDRDAMGDEGIKAYYRSLSDSDLKLVPGANPTRFHILPLTQEQQSAAKRAALREADRGGEMVQALFVSTFADQAFYAGCKRVTGVDLVADDGSATKGDMPRSRWDDIPEQVRLEIGLMIIDISTVPAPESAEVDVKK